MPLSGICFLMVILSHELLLLIGSVRDGGLFAKLQGAPELGSDDFTIV